MLEQCFLIEGFGPIEALEALHKFAVADPSRAAELYPSLFVRVVRPQIPTDDPAVTLLLRDPGRAKNRAALNAAYDAIVKSLRAASTAQSVDIEVQGFRPLKQAIVDLALSFTPAAMAGKGWQSDSLVNPLPGERLYAAFDMPVEQLSRMLASAHHYATQVRIAAGALTSSADGHLNISVNHAVSAWFWVEDDIDRWSWWSDDAFPAQIPLHVSEFAWNGSIQRFAWHEARAPYAAALPALAGLFASLPEVFGVIAPVAGASFLGAVYPLAEGEGIQFAYLGAGRFSFDFIEPVDETRAPLLSPVVEILTLRNDDQLAGQIREGAPNEGYRLHLRHTELRQDDRGRIQELSEQRALLDEELSILHGFSQPQPQLYCFEETQLASLVSTLASLNPNELNSGNVLYGFHGPQTGLPGRHFLLMNESVLRTGLERLAYWDNAAERPVKFWVDPRWAEVYQPGGARSLVFVPEGTVLAPDFHSWDVGTMDAYLHEVMKGWYSGDFATQELPPQPIYIFEEDIGQTVRLSVLGMSDFLPFASPDVVSWLNDGLVVIHRSDDIRNYISEVSNVSSRKESIEQAHREVALLESALEEHIRQSSDVISSRTVHIVESLTAELAVLEQSTSQLVERARTLNATLTALDGLYNHTATSAEPVVRAVGAANKELEKLDSSVAKLVKEAEGKIAQSEEIRLTIESEVSAEMDRLTSIRQRVNELITDLLARGNRGR